MKKSSIKTPATLFLDRQKLPYEVFECSGEIEGRRVYGGVLKCAGASGHQEHSLY
ncbi:hypothetical protein OURE66S_00654 [Oligella ureolytica]